MSSRGRAHKKRGTRQRPRRRQTHTQRSLFSLLLGHQPHQSPTHPVTSFHLNYPKPHLHIRSRWGLGLEHTNLGDHNSVHNRCNKWDGKDKLEPTCMGWRPWGQTVARDLDAGVLQKLGQGFIDTDLNTHAWPRSRRGGRIRGKAWPLPCARRCIADQQHDTGAETRPASLLASRFPRTPYGPTPTGAHKTGSSGDVVSLQSHLLS